MMPGCNLMIATLANHPSPCPACCNATTRHHRRPARAGAGAAAGAAGLLAGAALARPGDLPAALRGRNRQCAARPTRAPRPNSISPAAWRATTAPGRGRRRPITRARDAAQGLTSAACRRRRGLARLHRRHACSRSRRARSATCTPRPPGRGAPSAGCRARAVRARHALPGSRADGPAVRHYRRATLIARRENDEQLLAADAPLYDARPGAAGAPRAAPPGTWTKSCSNRRSPAWAAAAEQLAAVLSGDDTSVQSSLRLGEMLRVAGDHARALEVFERCVDRAARAGMTWEATIARADHAVCPARLGRLLDANQGRRLAEAELEPGFADYARAVARLAGRTARTARLRGCTASAMPNWRAPPGPPAATNCARCARRCWPANLSPIEPALMRLSPARQAGAGSAAGRYRRVLR